MRKRPWHSLILLNFTDTLDQIPDCCLVFFYAIDCQHIFDRRFFLFIFIKSSMYNQDWHSYFIGKAQLIPFSEDVTRKKHDLLTQGKRHLSSSVRIITLLKN